MPCARKPHGAGPASHLQVARAKKARRIASWLKPGLEQRARKIHATGEIFPRGGLRKAKVRRLFEGWVHKCQGKRVLTKALMRTTIQEVVNILGFYPTRSPDELYSDWLLRQANRLHELLRQAKKTSQRQAKRKCRQEAKAC